MKQYISQGEFGEFVENIIRLDEQRKNEQNEKEEDAKLWNMYVHSMSSESFNDWKKRVLSQPQPQSQHMGKEQLVEVINNTQDILSGFVPE